MSVSERTPVAKPVGVSGVVAHGDVLYWDDRDAGWKGRRRDETIIAMANDPLFGSVLLGIEFLIRRVDWHLNPPDDSAAAAQAAEFVDGCLADMDNQWPGDTLARILTYLPWGWSAHEVVYKRRQGPDGTPPSRFTDGKIGWHRWALRPQPTRYGWRFVGDEPVALIQQDPATFHRIDVPLAKCLLFRYASRDNSPEGFTPLRVAYDAWYNKRKLQRIEAIGIERDLAGLPVGRVAAADIAANSDVYQAMQTIVTNIRNDAQAGLVIASDRDEQGHFYQDVTLMATGGARSFDTDPIIKRYANEVVTVFLANVMRTGQDGTGSYALADVQGGLFQQAIGAHLDTIAQTITEQAIGPLCRLNGIRSELWPTLEHGDIESADLATTGKYFTDLGTAGLIEDTPELRHFLHEIAGFPVPTVEELQQREAEREAEAKKAAAALAKARAAQPPPTNGATPPNGKAPANQDGNAGGEAMMSELRRFVADDGTISLSDLIEVMAWWRSVVPEQYADILDAKVLTDG